MCHAAATGDIGTLERLRAAGVPINGESAGASPLWSALQAGQWAAAVWLLTHGASAEARLPGDETLLMVAVLNRDRRSRPNDETARELVDLLDSAGARVSAQNTLGVTALHHAATAPEDAAWLHALLSHPRVDINAKNARGLTPLGHAMENGNTRAAWLLMRLGAEMEPAEAERLGTPTHGADLWGELPVAFNRLRLTATLPPSSSVGD
jgi:ankyrin repeat protein